MASTPPTNLEDTQDPPADKPPTKSLGPSLDSLTPEQLTQDCQDILGEILQEVVICSEAGCPLSQRARDLLCLRDLFIGGSQSPTGILASTGKPGE